MYASKENARKAYRILMEYNDISSPVSSDLKFLVDFLTAAERKLPTEAAYRRAEKKPRKRTKLANG